MALKTESETLVWQYGRGVTYPLGFKCGSSACGLKKTKNDLAIILSEMEAHVAGVFTTNLVKASSVDFSQAIVKRGHARAIFCNSGNANACTGELGEKVTNDSAHLTAKLLDLEPGEVLVAATGIIGKQIPFEKIESGLPKAVEAMQEGQAADLLVSEAICTTDTFAKRIALTVTSPHWEGELRIGGITKGSGMIAPNMATTLCFLTTDADIEPVALQSALTTAMNQSFNRLTVDGDTSTNDMALILANGAGSAKIPASGPAFDDFQFALNAISIELAKMIAKDGEGATKLVEITVEGAVTEATAEKIAKTVAESPLVKTAFFGNDPNWGRIVAAAGRAGAKFDPNKLQVELQGVEVFAYGQPTQFDSAALSEAMNAPVLKVLLNLNHGSHEATVWTCDFSYDYVRINAEYST